MSLEKIILTLLLLVAPLLSVGLIKTILLKILEFVKGRGVSLGTGVKTVLGLVVSFLFFLVLQAGFLGVAPEGLEDVSPALLSLVSKAIYDGFNDLIYAVREKLED